MKLLRYSHESVYAWMSQELNYKMILVNFDQIVENKFWSSSRHKCKVQFYSCQGGNTDSKFEPKKKETR